MARHPGLRVVKMREVNMSSVNGGLLASLVYRLEELGMETAELTSQQVEEIMTAIGAGGCLVKLKKLDIQFNNMSTVDAGLLANAVNSLEEVYMYETDLKEEQMEAIMKQRLVKTSLRRLDMGIHRDLGLDMDLLARARLAVMGLLT